MSDVLTVIEPARDGGKPLLLVRCAGCGRDYRVACDKAQARKLIACRVCLHGTIKELRAELRAARRKLRELAEQGQGGQR